MGIKKGTESLQLKSAMLCKKGWGKDNCKRLQWNTFIQ